MKFFHPFCFIMFKTYLYIVFCQKLKIGKNYLLSHFGHYLISACREIRLVLVRWVTYITIVFVVKGSVRQSRDSKTLYFYVPINTIKGMHAVASVVCIITNGGCVWGARWCSG